MIEMTGAPYKEGFENTGTMATVFSQLLTVLPTSNTYKGSGRTTSQTTSSCSTTDTSTPPVTLGSEPADQVSFLHSLLITQKNTAISLMNTAKRIGPSAQKVLQAESAYNSAFESDIQTNTSGTFQEFILIFFIVSFCALAFVTIVMVYATTRSGRITAGTLVGFILLGITIFAILVRFG